MDVYIEIQFLVSEATNQSRVEVHAWRWEQKLHNSLTSRSMKELFWSLWSHHIILPRCHGNGRLTCFLFFWTLVGTAVLNNVFGASKLQCFSKASTGAMLSRCSENLKLMCTLFHSEAQSLGRQITEPSLSSPSSEMLLAMTLGIFTGVSGKLGIRVITEMDHKIVILMVVAQLSSVLTGITNCLVTCPM